MMTADTSILRLQAIESVATADNIEESVRAFRLLQPELGDCRFVFAAQNGGSPGYAVGKTFSSGAAILSLFESERVFVLDRDYLAAGAGRYDYAYDYSVSLDTSAVSVLQPFIEGRNAVPQDIVEVVQFLATHSVAFDPLPYALENFDNLNSGLGAAERIYRKALGYEALITADVDHLGKTGLLRSVLDPDALARRAARVVAAMYDGSSSVGFVEEMERLRETYYALLLQMALIQIGQPQMSLQKKLNALLSFCDQELAAMHIRELSIAKSYFERGQELRFFSRVQKNYKGEKSLFEVLQNMAWDIYHLRHLELAMGISRNPRSKYFFSALLTFDKDLIEVANLCSLRSIALVGSPPRPIAFPKVDILPFLDPNDAERVFSPEATKARGLRRAETEARRAQLIYDLEDRLARVACVAPKARGAKSSYKRGDGRGMIPCI